MHSGYVIRNTITLICFLDNIMNDSSTRQLFEKFKFNNIDFEVFSYYYYNIILKNMIETILYLTVHQEKQYFLLNLYQLTFTN
jgi:arabinogalactan endo-1,4-beta-galactosidase